MVTLALAAGCTDDGGSETTTTGAGGTTLVETTGSTEGSVVEQATVDLPIIDQIDDAVAALEAQLGATQQYFEINATAQFVNLFVALNNATIAQPWLYVDGTLSSSEGQTANGGTFAAAVVGFDPATILDTVRSELPGIVIASFYIHGDGEGNVLYGVLASSAKGGGLDVVLGADGQVISVDPLH